MDVDDVRPGTPIHFYWELQTGTDLICRRGLGACDLGDLGDLGAVADASYRWDVRPKATTGDAQTEQKPQE